MEWKLLLTILFVAVSYYPLCGIIRKKGQGMTEIIDFLKKYTDVKKNTEKVEISVLQLNRVIKALERELCEDAISREDATHGIDRGMDRDYG